MWWVLQNLYTVDWRGKAPGKPDSNEERNSNPFPETVPYIIIPDCQKWCWRNIPCYLRWLSLAVITLWLTIMQPMEKVIFKATTGVWVKLAPSSSVAYGVPLLVHSPEEVARHPTMSCWTIILQSLGPHPIKIMSYLLQSILKCWTNLLPHCNLFNKRSQAQKRDFWVYFVLSMVNPYLIIMSCWYFPSRLWGPKKLTTGHHKHTAL